MSVTSHWFDENGLIHVNPGEDSDNGILFTIVYFLLKDRIEVLDLLDVGHVYAAIKRHEKGDGTYYQRPGSTENDASHDNITAQMGFSYKFDLPIHKNIKLTTSLLHPRDIIYYSYLEGGALGRSLIWIVALLCIISCLKDKDYTSGKQMAWVRMECVSHTSFSMRMAQKACDLIMIWKYSTTPWAKMWAIYFKRVDHPIRVLANQLGI